MKKILQLISTSSKETKWFVLTGFIYAIALILSTIYVYLKIDVHTGLVDEKFPKNSHTNE